MDAAQSHRDSARRARGHSLIVDPYHDRLILFGGIANSGRLNDVWELRLDRPLQWAPLAPTGTPPSARYDHGAVYDPIRQRMLVFGGVSTTLNNDCWALDLAGPPHWSLVPATIRPRVRARPVAVFDPTADRLVVMGGLTSPQVDVDVWELSFSDPSTWIQLFPASLSSISEYNPAGFYDPTADRVIVFGNGFWSVDWGRAPVAVPKPPGSVSLALGAVWPNPAVRGVVHASFALSDGSPATLEVLDVAGRRVMSRAVGHLGAGTHAITWNARSGPGVYWVRLTGAARTSVRRFVVVE